MPSGPNSGSPNSASGRAVGRWRVPHDDWTLGANHVSRAPESGWPIPLLLISGLATGPPAGVGDGLRFLSRHCQHICPRSGRFVCSNSAFSRHFSTFYGPSVQAMDAQLKALPTLPVRARTVSGCVNSANLNISQHFTVHLFRPWIPSSARGKGGGPRRFTAIVLNVSRRRFGGPAGVEPQSPGERNGRCSRFDSRVLREATCPHRG